MTPPTTWLIVALALACMAAGAWSYQRMVRWWRRRTLARQFRRARAGEESAGAWLEQHGFTMIGTQVTRRAALIIDGTETPFVVRADYVVERQGVRGVVEVKTGAVANPTARATRRQILEYAWAYGVSEVYLFDADRQILRQIEIPGERRSPGRTASAKSWLLWAVFAAGIAVGLAAEWYAAHP